MAPLFLQGPSEFNQACFEKGPLVGGDFEFIKDEFDVTPQFVVRQKEEGFLYPCGLWVCMTLARAFQPTNLPI